MPRYAILEHHWNGVHWDVLLEHETSLLAWALSKTPLVGGPNQAKRLADHRLIYLDYEGEISGNRGVVTQWDSGHFSWLEHKEGIIRINIMGAKLQGAITLERTDTDQWSFEFIKEGSSTT